MFSTYQEAAAYLKETGVRRGDPLSMTLEEARDRQDGFLTELSRDLPPAGRIQEITIEGPVGPFTLRIYHPADTRDVAPVVLFIRGAGWWAGSLDTHARTMIAFAGLSGCAVCGIDYHRTPEFAYPVQKNEVIAALHWISTQGHRYGISPERIAILAESAGATTGLSAVQELRDRGEIPLSGLIFFYGNFGGPKEKSRPYSKWVWKQYLRDVDPNETSGAVPLNDTMDGIPFTWLGVGEMDPLLEDTLALAGKLKDACVPHEVVRYPEMPHAFVMMNGLLEPAAKALSDAANVTRKMLST